MSKRIEKDTMGEMEVPMEALYGASTQRAVINFPKWNSCHHWACFKIARERVFHPPGNVKLPS